MSKCTFEDIVRIVLESIDLGGASGGPFFAGTSHGYKAGSSAWSSPMNMMTDEDEEDQGLWQNNLKDLSWQYKKEG